MAIIYSYPTVTPTSDDLVLGTDVNGEGKPTKNFTIQSIVDIVQGGATGLGAVLTISGDALQQPATNFTNVQGTGTSTFGSFIDGTMTISSGVGTGFTSITSTDFQGNLTGIVKAGSSIQGTVTGVTQAVGTSNATLATTKFVMDKVDPSVLTFDGTSGGDQTVNLAAQKFSLLGTANEIESVGTAQTITFGFPAAGVVLPDGSTATTQAASDDSTKIATTAFVRNYDDTQDLDFSGTTGSGSVLLNSQTLAIAGTANQIVTNGGGQTLTIALTDPIITNLTGNVTGILKDGSSIETTVTGVTQTAGNDSTRLATTEYVDAAAGAKTLDYAGDSTGPFALNLSTDDLEFNGDTNITVTAATVTANKGIVTIDLNNDVGISGTMTAGTFTDGTFSGTAGTYTGGVSITSSTFTATNTPIGFIGNASTATALASPGTIQLLSGSGATQGVASNAVTYTSGGDVQLTTTLADTTVTAKALTNLPTPTSAAINANDTILAAMAKLQGQITGIAGSLAFEGTWDARTVAEGGAGTPPSATPVNGQFWIVDPAGSQDLDGITDWLVGDWAIYVSNGAGTDAWQKLDQSNEVLGSGAATKLALWTSTNTLGTGLISDDGATVTIGTNGNLVVQGDTTLGDNAALDTVTLNGPTTFESTGRFKKGIALGTATDGSEYGASNQVLTASTSAGSPPTWETPTTGTVTSVAGGTGITITGTATATPTVNIDTVGTDNAIEVLTAAPAATGDFIWFSDINDSNTLRKSTLANLPFVPAVSGTQYTIPMFATASTLDDSIISQNAGATEATISGNLNITGLYKKGGSQIALNDLSNASTTYNGVYLGRIDPVGLVVGAAYNIVIGEVAGNSLTSGGNSIFIGHSAGKATTAQSHNVFIGHEAGIVNTLGSNIGIGSGALEASTSADSNVAIGHHVAKNLTTGDRNIYIGQNVVAGAVDASREIVIGNQTTGNGSNTITLGDTASTVFYGGKNGIDIGSAVKPWGDLYVDNGSFDGNLEANYFVATAANTTNSASKIVTEMHQTNEGGHSVYGSTTSSAADYLIKLKSSDASVSSNAFLLTQTLAQFGTGRITIGNQGTSNRLISMGYQEQWEFYQNSQTTLQFRKGTATTKPIYEVNTGGSFTLNQYGSGNNTGTATYNLEVDSSGKIIETPSTSPGGGGGTFHGDQAITNSTPAQKAFTLNRATTGTLIFDVWFTSETSTGTSVAKKYTVAHAHNATPVYNKIIDTGPLVDAAGNRDFTVSFVNAGSGLSVECYIIGAGIASQNIGYTVQVGYDSTNALTFTAAS